MGRGKSVLVVTLVCLIAACSSATEKSSDDPSMQVTISPTPTVTVLDEEMAGERYMTIVCVVNRDMNNFDEFSAEVPYGVVMTNDYRQRMRELGRTWKKAGLQLVDSDYEWPEDVAPSIERIAEQFYGYSAAIIDASREETVEPINWDDTRKYSDRVRLRLGLPPGGTGCKKYVG